MNSLVKASFQSISPIDGSVYVERPYASEQDIERILEAAHKAQKVWKKTSLAERARYCTKALDYFQSHTAGIAEELTWQMGRPIRYTPMEIKGGFLERARYMIEVAPKALEEVEVESSNKFKKFITREPLGTVLVLSPWNYPYLTSVNAIIPALMAGNTVILKHSEQTPLCAERYAAAFEFAGLPPGVFQYFHVSNDQVRNVILDPRIHQVSFTGSVEGGRAVQKAVGERLVSAGLELGGKDPAYVRQDADLHHAIENLVDGAFFNSGQSCCGIERIYVHKEVYRDFVEGFVELTKKYKVGDPRQPGTTLGPMVRKQAAEKASQQVENALKQGAEVLIQASDFPSVEPPYFNPQVLVNVNHTMEIMQEESFAPIVGIMPVSDDNEAVALMNDSKYGLTASIWTQDEEQAMALGDLVQTGTWFMNRCDYLDPALAWAGVKQSGRGCTLSTLGYETLTRPKSYHLKRV